MKVKFSLVVKTRSVNSYLAVGPSKGDVVTQPETLIKSGASFGIAGDGMSVVFTGEAPPNMPNRPVSQSCLIE